MIYKEYFLRALVGFGGLILAMILVACSQPVLESSQCFEARDDIKKFYSFHVGNEPGDSIPFSKFIEDRRKYLTDDLFNIVKDLESADAFTFNEVYPTAFRVGKCQQQTSTSLQFNVILFWLDAQNNTSQKSYRVDAVKSEMAWKIDGIAEEK